MIKVLVGPNRFALQKELEAARQAFLEKYGELSVESLDGEEVEMDDITSALQSGSLFASNKLVVIKALSANKQASEKIEQIIDSVPDETQLLVVEPQPDKRSSYFKTLKKQTEIKEFAELDESRLAQWLTGEAKSKGAELSMTDARYLIMRVSAHQTRLYSELLKLIDHNSKITRSTIDLLTADNPQNTIFQLLDAAFSGNRQRAFELYDNLRLSGSQPQMLLAMIAWQMHQVALVASAGSKPANQIAADSGLKPFSLQKSQGIARKLGIVKIRELLAKLEAFDKKTKTETINIDEGLKSFLAGITS